jgi:hypothetical protein
LNENPGGQRSNRRAFYFYGAGRQAKLSFAVNPELPSPQSLASDVRRLLRRLQTNFGLASVFDTRRAFSGNTCPQQRPSTIFCTPIANRPDVAQPRRATPLRGQPDAESPTAAIAFGPPRFPPGIHHSLPATSPSRTRPNVPNVGAPREPWPRGPDARGGQPHHPFASQGALR